MKVFPFKIPKSGEDPLIYQEDREIVFYDKLHQHEEIQISFIEKGQGAIFAGDTISHYREGDILMIGSNLPHVFRSEVYENESSIMRTLFFTTNSFGKEFFTLTTFKNIHPFLESSKNGFIIHNAPKKITKSFKKLKKADNYERFILFLEIIKWLSNSDREQLSNHLYDKKITDNEGKRMQTVFEHVMTNYQKNINLDEIASIANMTKNAFCRYFKVRTNKSFFQFLIEVRIEHASKLLANNSELSVLEIAELCGFNNISNFNRKFKELKQSSPLQYRKLNL
ncbi:AraC family transcriptional regulator [Flavobacterium collinsii]|jgi:AraC-like DNA-binding protein|uniref:HTH-type transcriptional activator RhaR n=1 Tax=Flavobacterium collinsii TaxID=1114861 RepID=A0A9W4TD57_9FLAO|nr:AraC family transcriptional regulator [Flavobacterium collinsii]GIQ58464.1 AraC family transcriptional regulator [Flavobacterium collinsii]CAA9194925.1 HTH-type transcriptional activator RhaR [Flavobacterium collinsii]CAI2765294.1 transcriptional regulator, AraC family [Flavobacterium collinsii]